MRSEDVQHEANVTGSRLSTIHISFHPTIEGGAGTWQCLSDGGASSASPIALHLNLTSSNRLSESAALEVARRVVERHDLREWLGTHDGGWTIDLNSMRKRFVFLAGHGWLQGMVPARWTYKENEDTFAGRIRQRQTLTMILTPETLAASRAKSRREDDLSDATRLAVLEALWILECDLHLVQASAFSYAGGVAVTCAHVRCEDAECTNLRAFRPSDATTRYRVHWLAWNRDIDLGFIRIEGATGRDLEPVSGGQLDQLDRVWVAGFPNYRPGDTASVSAGRITAFRTVAGIRRLLTDARIVAGNSGGPGFTSDGRVVGVAVTGADCPEEAHKTDNHGLVPIEALRHLERLGDRSSGVQGDR